ncbi:MAG: hypothetical protein IPP77_00530 [Bacteroidetes bacterium]|nr:hypothetical protein [Bacteroidota bacterium]
MKHIFILLLTVISLQSFCQKRAYDVYLFGDKIGRTIVERVETDHETIEYKLESKSEMNILFTKKTAYTYYDVVYKEGKLFSSYYKDVKDEKTLIVTMLWDGAKYVIKRGNELLEFSEPIYYSALSLYFTEPKDIDKFFSERLVRLIHIIKKSGGNYECNLEKGVSSSYSYENGILQELKTSKGVSVIMKLVH